MQYMYVFKRYIVIIFSIALGMTIYLLFRHTTTSLYLLATKLGFSESIDNVRDYVSFLHFPAWFIYSLPDGLWMFSFVLLMMSIWDFRLTGPGKVWIYLSILLGITFEIFQAFVSRLGFFDWIDMIFIILGAVLPLLLFNNKNNFYEKV